MADRKNRFRITALALACLLLFTGLAHADGGGSSCGTDCHGDIICSIASIGEQVYCAAADKFYQITGSATDSVLNLLLAVTLSTPGYDDPTLAFYTQIVFVIESILLVLLLFAGVRLIYSSVLGPGERMEAKQQARQAVVNMFLVGVSYPLYLLAADVTKALAAAVGPTSSEFNAAVFASLVTALSKNFIFSLILLLALLLACLLASFRFVIAFIGLFLLPFALCFESFWVTASIGRGLKLLIATNFVVQVLQALFLKLLVFALGSNRSFFGGSWPLVLAAGTLLFGAWVIGKLYANAFEFHPGSTAAGLAMGVAGGAVTQVAYQRMGWRSAADGYDPPRQPTPRHRRTMEVGKEEQP